MADRLGSVALGTNVRAIRRNRNLTQTELALKAGITKSYVCRIEKGTRPVKPELLDRLADALDVEVAALDESTLLETRSTVWVIEVEHGGQGVWGSYETPDGPNVAKDRVETLRARFPDTNWRAVRVETIETVEVW